MSARTPSSTPASSIDKTGHSDSPRQDTQRPEHADHADAGGQESTTRRLDRSQRPADVPAPAGAPSAPGERHAEPPLPSGGRQPQRPGQDGRAEEGIGERDTEAGKNKPDRGR